MRNLALLSLLLLVAAAALADDVVVRGDPISADTKVVPLADVLANPDAYAKTPIVVEGVVQAACQKMGCWMEVAPASGKAGMRVTFKDYGFFVPKDSPGRSARMEGVVEIKTLSKDEADHLEGEGAKLNRAKDGTAKEVSFVASGVELRKSS